MYITFVLVVVLHFLAGLGGIVGVGEAHRRQQVICLSLQRGFYVRWRSEKAFIDLRV